MTLFLNYLPWIILIIGGILIYNFTKHIIKIAIITLAIVFLARIVTDVYVPKNPASKIISTVEESETREDLIIEDRFISSKIADSASQDRLNKLFDWKK